jgi:hypothetical protein
VLRARECALTLSPSVVCTFRFEFESIKELEGGLMMSLDLDSSSTFSLEEKGQKTTTSQHARRHFLHLRKNLKNDNESRASQLVIIFCILRKKPRNDNEPPSLLSSTTLGKKNKEMMMSQGGL